MFEAKVGCRRRWNFTLCGAVIGTCAFSASVLPAADQNWGQWRGPVGTGVAPDGNPPVEWSESKNVKWKVKIPGEGLSTPIVWGNRVFVQAAISSGRASEPAVAQADTPRPGSDSATASASVYRKLLDRFDANKDRQISRAEVPEGTLRGMFDRLADQHKLDAQKTHTRDELEKLLGVTASGGNSAATGAAGEAPPPSRRPGGFGGGGGGGGGRGARPSEKFEFVLMCLDRQTGKTVWQQLAHEEVPHEGHHRDGSFASSSPVTDGEHIFAYFGSYGLHCYDMAGHRKWSKDFGDQRITNTFGEGSSPTLVGNAIIVKWDHEGDSFIIALDKNTGETLWKKSRDERTSWSTPLLVEHAGKQQIVTTATNRVRSYDPASGDLLWECGGMTANVIPTPVAGPGMVYAISGHRGNSLLAIRLGRSGNLTGSDAIAWEHHKGTPYVPSPLLFDDRLYFFSGNNPILTCFDVKTGKPLIDGQRLSDLQGVYASPVAAAGRVYLVGRNGTTLVLKPADTLEVIATNRLDEPLDASPAIAGNELFLRSREHLYCIAEK